MIRGVKQPFKLTTNVDFNDINRIEVVFSQPHNQGNPPTAPMPIVKYYDKQLEKVDAWSEDGKEHTKTYQVDTKYYWGGSMIGSDVPPTEADILSNAVVQTYPLASTLENGEIYKRDTSYYQYNPANDNWDITNDAPSIEPQVLTNIGDVNTADKKRPCVYEQSYYRYVGTAGWERSTGEILPLEEIGYWDSTKADTQNADDTFYYDRNKTYCALETYYKYIDGSWHVYGRPKEVRVLDASCNKSDIYMMKELYYQYNVETDQFEKTGVREVYYKYNTQSNAWEECEYPCANAVEIDLWIETEDHDVNKTYVCKNVYYRYNAGLKPAGWEASNNMLVPVIEIDEWVEGGNVYYDPSKIYMCQARHYQYNIESNAWEEVDAIASPKVINLNYWTEQSDKHNIYLCGPTYFQYDADNQKWISEATFNVRFVKIDDPSEATDSRKVYECSPTYYAYRGDKWESYKDVIEAVRNDGFAPVAGDSKSFVVELTAEETMRFIDKYKGRVQAKIDDISHPIQYFSVYPTLIDEISTDA